MAKTFNFDREMSLYIKEHTISKATRFLFARNKEDFSYLDDIIKVSSNKGTRLIEDSIKRALER